MGSVGCCLYASFRSCALRLLRLFHLAANLHHARFCLVFASRVAACGPFSLALLLRFVVAHTFLRRVRAQSAHSTLGSLPKQ
eukprot:3780377-Rhodomonas_salina.1